MDPVDRVRGFLPPTTRNMEGRLSVLNSKIEAVEHRLAEVEMALIDIRRLIEEHGIAYSEIARISDSTFACLGEVSKQIDSLAKAQRYSNVEYVRLLGLPADKEQILVVGWYGAENLGDELMLKTLLGYFNEEMLLRTTVLLWDCEDYPRFELDHRVRTIHYPKSTWDLESLADAYDVIVWGGGAIIDEGQFTSDPGNINTGNIFIRLNELALARKKRVYCLGLSSNRSFKDFEYAARLREVVDKAEIFSVRDPYSAESLKRLGVSSDAIVECQDIVFANNSILRLREKRKSCAPRDYYKLGIVLFFTEGRLHEYIRVVEEIRAVVEKLKPSYEIALIPFLNEGGIDAYLYGQVLKGISSGGSTRIAEYSEEGILNELADCDFCICYKYHAALVANLLGVRSLNVCYDEHPHYYNKMKNLADVFQYQSHLVSSRDFEGNVAETLTDAMLDTRKPCVGDTFIDNCIEWIRGVCVEIGKDELL